jgi:outer membrane protein assembly factor BamD
MIFNAIFFRWRVSYLRKMRWYPCLLLLLSGCSKDIDFEAIEQYPAQKIFEMGQKEEQSKHYTVAVKIFEELERLYPYSKLIADAQLHAGECSYKAKKYDEAISFYEIFVKTHPTHEKVAYAIYMLGLINYEQMPIVQRDQEPTVASIAYFRELCNRFPDSEYTELAKEKIKNLREQIAGREVYIARYYQKRGNYAAAIGRLNSIVDLYIDTTHAPEAMHRLVECYVVMGFFEEANAVSKILCAKYGDSKWAAHAQELLGKK